MEIQFQTMVPIERFYSYSQSQQISMQTGFIGYLRADMGSNGEGFFSTWNDFRADLKTEDFKAEFDDVINSLRDDGGFLHNRQVLSRFCYNAGPGCSFDNDRNEYGVRVNTENYAYFMRLNPNKGEYNLYCYCYRRDWLDRHMKQAEKGIRFITPDYKEKFRVPDGETVRITTGMGETLDRIARYIDDCHVEIGRNLYHICEFAERLEQSGGKVIPLRSTLPDKCYNVLPSSGEIIIVNKGESGYYHTGKYGHDHAETQAIVAECNESGGVTKAQAAAMLAGSMFGWEVPAADPKNYDEQGQPIKPKQKDRGDAR